MVRSGAAETFLEVKMVQVVMVQVVMMHLKAAADEDTELADVLDLIPDLEDNHVRDPGATIKLTL